MSDQPRPNIAPLSPSQLRRIDRICNRFEALWKAGQRPQLKDYLASVPEPEGSALLQELLALQLAYRGNLGELPVLEEYRQQFPEHLELVEAVFRDHAALAGQRTGAVDESHQSVRTRPELGAATQENAPPRLGRYWITATLGEGGFGIVYRGYDDELRRDVAIKVPHRQRVAGPADLEAYLAEARVLANLKHPHIVPVHDVGRTEDGLCFVVSQFIEGHDLKQRLKEARPSFPESADLVATVAEALHYAHRKGLVHRDIKPGNILLDSSGKPFVVDFGLALAEENFGQGPTGAGTPAYMSPEQARGEGHRVDGRSDIFSLGVVFYELLTGKRPFKGASAEEVLDQITLVEPRPPRQVDDTIPKELERICLKALSKRASERYTTAKDLAEDLRHFLAGQTINPQSGPASTPTLTASTPASKIVPKGLRSFDAHDADFFLELLPGPRDREGLPDSLRFWKTRIEETDPDQTFAVGLLYGPSGCGKSSLVKAGLLPRLAGHVVVIYVEATGEETETRLLRGLHRRCPDLSADLGLVETLAALRRGRGLAAGQKVLIVLDQFEQWLHARRGEANAGLMQALRQCDGERVQCLVLVRDDFWMAVGRFLEELEIRLVPGENAAAVDLFDLRHARKVLAAFGRAFGALPAGPGQLTKEQEAFLAQAVAGLEQDGRVICVRLALFAEMVKGRPWTPATLKEVGGAAGVGVAFLEETFSSPTAKPGNRLHQQAARAVLKALLPEQGSDIKGNMRSRKELLEASGYARRPGDFEGLLQLLDGEVRLITPTEPAGEGSRDGQPPGAPVEKYYQLTHDYLVHSLRNWLTRKQRETYRGRAELRLAERAAVWTAKPESRHLPAWWEWLNIRICTHKKDWTPPQRLMMRKAGRDHAGRGLALLLVVLLLGWGGYEVYGSWQAEHLVQQLVTAETGDKEIPRLITQLRNYRSWARPRLRRYLDYPEDSKEHLHASLALLPEDQNQEKYLHQRLLKAGPVELRVIRDALLPQHEDIREHLWNLLLKDRKNDPDPGLQAKCFRAACALAADEVEGANRERWREVSQFVVDRLLNSVKENPSHFAALRDILRPVRERLKDPLSKVFGNADRPQSERSFAASFLADYTDRPEVLVQLVLAADENQFAVLFPRLEAHQELALQICKNTVAPALDTQKTEEEKERLAKQQANAGVILLRFGQADQVWPLLIHSPDPRARSYLIHRLSPLGADPRAIIRRLDEEQEVSIRRALLLSLGEYGPDQLSAADREPLVPKVFHLYRADLDPGVHGAAEWFLRQWNKDKRLKEIDEAWAKDQKQREERLKHIKQELVKNQGKAKPQWYVNGQGQTMAIIPGPVVFLMGSSPLEAGREGGPDGKMEKQHKKRIGRSFAITTKEVTVEQFLRFRKDHTYNKVFAPTLDCPVNAVTWYDAVAYCNWLSKQEGIPEKQWCYLPNDKDEYAEGMKLAPDYLQRTGYRLPSEAEWEYACRAGAVTSRFYGETEELLGRYAWHTKNSLDRGMLPGVPGSLGVRGDCLKPNDFGLFDMLGNALEWCQDSIKYYSPGEDGKPSEDIEDKEDINNKDSRVFRGGAFLIGPLGARSAFRYGLAPALRNFFYGFRVARTFR